MSKKFTIVNVTLSFVFLLTIIFPLPLFSYETKDYKTSREAERNWTDESLDYKPIIYKKARCPRCGMEFYYVEGKEGPHSHWVHYEVIKEDTAELESDLEKKLEKAESEERKKKELLGLFTGKKDTEKLEERLSQLEKEKEMRISQLEGLQPKYELRQKLTCPYDGHSFFPEGDVIEDIKLIQRAFAEEASIVEQSFAKSIPFGASKELRQFGYDLFLIPEEERQEKRAATGETTESLGALALLKAAFAPKTESSTLSPQQAVSQTAVVPVGPDYVIGPGDTLIVNIWGSVQESFPLEIDREGKVMLPKAGPVYLWGLKFKEAEARIKQQLDRYYTNFYMDLSMGKLRQIQVYVMGEVKKPGSYNINSQSSIFQALYASGGPTKMGSLRKIKLIHADGKEEKIDLYPFLLEGQLIMPSWVQSGDTVFVPTIGDIVAITGNVKRPAIYETGSDVPLQDLLGFAGGITPTGDLQRLQVERIQNNEKRVIVDIELSRPDIGRFSFEDINMKNGDMVIVSPVVRLKHDFVSIIGNVERPGDYALSKGMKVSDLVDRAKGFLPATYLQRAEIARVTRDRTRQVIPVNLDNIMLGAKEEDVFLNEWDILLVYSEAEVKPPLFVEIYGAVSRPGKYELTPGMNVSDLIFKAGGVKQNEVIRGGELFHIMPGEQPVVRQIGIKYVSVSDILIDKDIMLRAGDVLSVRSEPRLTMRKIVTIKGEVRYPGTYSIREGEKLSSLIERAGGFTKDAFPDGAIFTRESIREVQERMRQRFIERENRSILEEQQSILMRREATVSTGQLSQSLQMRREMLEYIASAEMEGRMVIKLKAVSESEGNRYDILLEDGDALMIPQVPSAVTVIGSVNNPASIPFVDNRGVEYYIRRTGGLTKHADKKGIYVIKASGEAVSKFMMSKKVERGDTVVIPQEFRYWTPPGQLLRDTLEMLSRIAIGVGIIAALD